MFFRSEDAEESERDITFSSSMSESGSDLDEWQAQKKQKKVGADGGI